MVHQVQHDFILYHLKQLANLKKHWSQDSWAADPPRLLAVLIHSSPCANTGKTISLKSESSWKYLSEPREESVYMQRAWVGDLHLKDKKEYKFLWLGAARASLWCGINGTLAKMKPATANANAKQQQVRLTCACEKCRIYDSETPLRIGTEPCGTTSSTMLPYASDSKYFRNVTAVFPTVSFGLQGPLGARLALKSSFSL